MVDTQADRVLGSWGQLGGECFSPCRCFLGKRNVEAGWLGKAQEQLGFRACGWGHTYPGLHFENAFSVKDLGDSMLLSN